MNAFMLNTIDGGLYPLDEVCYNELKTKNKEDVSWLTYGFYSSLLILLFPLVLVAKTINVSVNFFKRRDPNYAQLHDHLKKYTIIHIKKYNEQDVIELTKYIQKLQGTSKNIILDVISLETNLSHIGPILQGANVEILGDEGRFFHEWKGLNAKQRPSSHHYDHDLSYSVNGNVFNEFLFWKDRENHQTRFQLEGNTIHNPLLNFSSFILHLKDYLNYKRYCLQQGQFGESPFTEEHPIRIVYNHDDFQKNRFELQQLIEVINE